ncbi:MAG TPA: phage tail sheath subtilisin-like domain-containing protein [Caulobacteraceae bacterium]|nr:phage tail sheath subtilisin-like domain-containing protein [Caulobacteraceae bacterium]
MTVPFRNIPANLRVPLFFAEIDNSHANTAQFNQRALVIGQITSAGAATPNVPLLSNGPADAIVQGGPGSMLALMVAAYAANDGFGEVWQLPLADAGGSAAAAGNISFTGPATAAGTLNLYIAGQLVQVAVTSAMTAAQLATALVAACALVPTLPVSVAVDGTHNYQVDFTALNKGLAGNDIDLELNFRGSAAGEVTPAGIVGTITAMSGGSINPTLTTALANLVDMPFDFIVCPYTDATSMAAISALLNDQAGRWSWNVQIYGHAFYAYRGTSSALTTFGVALNDQHSSVMGVQGSPTPMWVWAAAVAGAAAASLKVDPGVPLQTLAVNGVLAPAIPNRFPLSIRNSLLFDGISTFTVDASGQVRIENLITTYQRNAQGVADDSYLEIETMFLLMYVLRTLQARVTSIFARCKLAADGTRFAPGSNIVTPNIIRVDQIAAYRDLEYRGFVQRSDLFAAAIVVEQNATNPNRVDVLWPGILIDQLRIFALLAQFRLSAAQLGG